MRRSATRRCGTAAAAATCGLLRTTAVLRQKKKAASAGAVAYGGLPGSHKGSGDDKWAQAAMEYVYEKRHVNDARKRQHDVDAERALAAAHDRYAAVNERVFEQRLAALLRRMSEALTTLQQLGLDEALEEAVLLHTEQPPGSFRRPSLTPPVPNYEPGYGLAVAQLQHPQPEYPPTRRVTDTLQFGAQRSAHFPYVDVHHVSDLTASCRAQTSRIRGEVRAAAPLTGVEGEAWEAYMALQTKALARQQLLLDLHNDDDFRARYDADAAVRAAEWRRRGLRALVVEDAAPAPASDEVHYAQVPAYEPFRAL